MPSTVPFLDIVGEGFFFGTFGSGSGDGAFRELSSIVLFLGRFAFETGPVTFDDLDASDWSLSMSDFVNSNELSGSSAFVFFFGAGFSLVDTDFCTVFFLIDSDFFLVGRPRTFFDLIASSGSVHSSSETDEDFATDLIAGFRDGCFLVFLPAVFLVSLEDCSGSSTIFSVVFFAVFDVRELDLVLGAFALAPLRSIDSTVVEDFASV